VTATRPSLTKAEFDALYHEVSNWDSWGDGSARGTLNYLTPDRVVAAARLVRSGVTVSLSLPMDTDARPDNPVPPQHHMTQLADPGSEPEQFIKDFVGADYHNDGHSHLDALCHVSYHGKLFSGVPDSSATTDGAALGDVTTVCDGIVGRGVLLDIPRLHGASWEEPGHQVTAHDLVAAEESQHIRVGPGDLLFVRLGHNGRLAELGPWDTTSAKAGLHPTTARLLRERRIAVLGSDTNSDAAPSTTERVPFPIHVLAVNAMGMYLLDYLQLEELAATCERLGRWEFLSVVAPLRVVGGTGSPVNPIAVF
jgi:kynurenine formamidase